MLPRDSPRVDPDNSLSLRICSIQGGNMHYAGLDIRISMMQNGLYILL
jgi:hypothetical protein